METIAALENEIHTPTGDFPIVLVRAYLAAHKAGNALIDIDEGIFESDVPAFIAALKTLGINEFTISAAQSHMAHLLALFTHHGTHLVGLTEVNDRPTQPRPAQAGPRRLPAFHLKVI